MDESTTLNELVKYYYQETEMIESVMVQRAIDKDPEVEEMYEELKSIGAYLDTIMLQPSQASIDTIFAYAKLSAPLH